MIYAEDGESNCPGLIGFAGQVEAAQVSEEAEIVKISRPAEWETLTGREIKDGYYLDFSGRYWFDTLKDYAAFADRYRNFKPRPIPPQAYEPVWCSWYTLTTGVNEKNIWENAVIAKSLGFGTILIDAGWDTPGDVCMKDNSTYGDRYAYRGKFPHMTEMVDRIHKELGMAVELWASPWSVGFKARAAKEIADARTRIGKNQNPSFFLCPRCDKSGDFLAKNLSDVFKYYHIDGMWWDFIDSVPIYNCQGHKHDYETYGQGYNANMTKIVDAIHAVKPDALIEIRLKSSNINNKLFANVLETYDTPLWFQDNRQLLVYVRAFAAGCVPKTDPTMWLRSKEEGLKDAPNDLVGRFMATMITVGVPAVSQDFTKMPEENKRVVKAYLDFYHAHKADLISADFRPIGRDKMRAHYVLEGRDAYLYSGTQGLPELTLKKPHQTLYLFSAAEKPDVQIDIEGLTPGTYRWTAKDPLMQTVSEGTVDASNGALSWLAPIPSGGVIVIESTAPAATRSSPCPQ